MFSPNFAILQFAEFYISLGYTSSGGFSFDEFTPLTENVIKPIAPAYTLHVSGQKLEKKDGPLGASGIITDQQGSVFAGINNFVDPFFVLSRNGVKLHRSEAVKQDLNPKWSPFNVNILKREGKKRNK